MGRSLGDLEQMILFALVALGPEAYGASIRREIEERTGREVRAGAIYTVLDRLDRSGLIHSWIGEPTAARGGRRKRHYRIRPEGARRLRACRERMNRMAEGLDVRLAQLATGSGAE